MSNQVDVARALKDKDYFHSLTAEQQDMVRGEGGVGDANITDDSLESASGGLGGGAGQLLATGTDPTFSGARGSASTLVICNC
ncbi:MAG TPA: hypothetical protein VKK31_13630 [Thermoanaerobaculia bacterium]|nr:hypothetical protein [Thermoanaerobaculia bacterium]